MLINDLIRLGEPLKEGLDAKEVLDLVGDYRDEKVKNHFRHVLVVELPIEKSQKAKAAAIQQFGDEITIQTKDEKSKKDFLPLAERARGIPFTVPAGGNPISPQGRYGLPIYPCWTRHLDEFSESKENVIRFLSYKKTKNQLHRLDRTPNFDLTNAEINQIAKEVNRVCSKTTFTGKKGKHLGLLILARCDVSGAFEYSETKTDNRIAESKLYPGKYIVPRYKESLTAAWIAKEEEGAEKGEITNGVCSFLGTSGRVISTYCKAWPWAGLTWTCPFPNAGDETSLIESVALSTSAYRSMTLGARLFYRLSKRIGWEVLPEVFSPSESRAGKDMAQRRKAQDLPSIYGAAYLLPLLDIQDEDKPQKKAFVRGVRGMLNTHANDKYWAEGQLKTVAGFDAFMPPEFVNDKYRLNLVYYSVGKQITNVDIRSMIEDVVPSTVGKVRKLANDIGQQGMTLLNEINPTVPEGRRAYFDKCFRSVPYLLARAYGGGFLWQQLERVLHRKPLLFERPIKNTANRLNSLVPRFPETRFDIADEVAFLIVFRQFAQQFNSQIAENQPNKEFEMRPWKELIELFERGPIDEIRPQSTAETGFLCGLVTRRFSGWYSKHMGKDKDYLKDRILTFGATISPREVTKALEVIRSVSFKYPGLKKDLELGQLAFYENKDERQLNMGDFEKRLGVALAMVNQERPQIQLNKDEFMTGFWSGYSLQGYDRPRIQKPKTNRTKQEIVS